MAPSLDLAVVKCLVEVAQAAALAGHYSAAWEVLQDAAKDPGVSAEVGTKYATMGHHRAAYWKLLKEVRINISNRACK